MAERIGIYGGSFDPVHLGHLWVAEHCREQLPLDRVIFVPAATSPLKPAGPVADDASRLMMLQRALNDGVVDGSLQVDDRELRRGGTSYTIDTVQELAGQHPDAQWYLLVGSDAFASIQRWHRPAELLQQITPAVFLRGGDAAIDWRVLDGLVTPRRAAEIRCCRVQVPMIEVSSSDIRRRVAQRRSIRFRVPAAVQALIDTHALYQAAASPP